MTDETTYPEQLLQRLRGHEQWVTGERASWLESRNMYEDDAYRGQDDIRTKKQDGQIFFEVNRIKPWVQSYVASLFYKGMSTVVTAGEAEMVEVQDDNPPEQAMQLLFDRFLATELAEELTEQAFRMGLIYPHAALKVGIDKRIEDPLHAIWLYCAPVQEVFWDRYTPSRNQQRWKGHVYQASRDSLKARFPERAAMLDEAEGRARFDAIEDGVDSRKTKSADKTAEEVFLRVLEFWDHERSYEEGDDSESGTYSVWLVCDSELKELYVGAIAYEDVDGLPLDELCELVLDPRPESPLWGLSAVASLTNLNREENFHRTTLARASRLDAARAMVSRKGVFDDDVKAKWAQGEDMEWLEVETQEPLASLAMFLPQQPVAGTTRDNLNFLREDREATAGTSAMTRGQSLDYASATEVQSLNAYTETMLGIFRKKMDKGIAHMLRVYQRVLGWVMDQREATELKVYHNYKTFTVKREWLDLRWDIKLRDFATTPQAESTRRLELSQIMDALLKLGELAAMPDPINPDKLAYQALLAREMLDYMVELYSLPDTWRFANLEKARDFTKPEEAAAAAAAPGDPALEGGPLPAEGGPLPEVASAQQSLGDIAGALEAGGAEPV